MIRLPLIVTNRFGEPLRGAVVHITMGVGRLGQLPEQAITTGRDGRAVAQIASRYGPGRTPTRFRVTWTGPDGVVWGFGWTQDLALILVRGTMDVTISDELGVTVTTRAFPQPLPLPEVSPATRAALLAGSTHRPLHEAYEEARDSLIAGLPNASAVLLGKTLETAIFLRGATLGWPTTDWAASKKMLGDLLRVDAVKADLEGTFTLAFYRRLLGLNLERIMGAHQLGEAVTVDEARAALGQVTRVLDGWFGVVAST